MIVIINVLTARPFKFKNDFYKFPIKSSKLGIYFLQGEKETIFNVNEIKVKYMAVPYKSGQVVFPILHTFRGNY